MYICQISAHDFNRTVLLGRWRRRLVHQTLGMDPAQRATAHTELASAAGHDYGPGQHAWNGFAVFPV